MRPPANVWWQVSYTRLSLNSPGRLLLFVSMNSNDKQQPLPHFDPVLTALSRTYVVVVTFCPDMDVLGRQFARLAQQGVNVIVVDNHSPAQIEIANLASGYSYELVALSDNLGVAGAQNTGLDRVRSRHGEYIIFLDQDSIPVNGALVALVNGLLAMGGGQKVAAVGSSYTLPSGNRGSSFVRFGWFHFKKIYCNSDPDTLQEVDFLISSGTLIPLSVLTDVGPMNNELFIDHVDTEWFLRARSRGYRSFGCCSAQMSHALGERTIRIWLGRWRTVPVHKGFRYFFTFRNSIWLYRQPCAPGKWVTADLMRLIYIFIFSGIFMSSRKDNLKWMFRGIRAGFDDASEWDSQAVIKEAHGEMIQ